MNSPTPYLLAVFCAALLLSSGCVSSKYKMAGGGVPPAPTLNLRGDHATLGTYVDSVIVYHGPGSWKRDAYWDEYVVSLENRGAISATLLSAELLDSDNFAVAPAKSWEKLESESRQWWDSHVLAQNLALGAGTVFVGVGMVAAPIGAFLAYAALQGFALTPVGAAFIAVPLAAGWLSETNGSHEKKIAAEFSLRRLELPAELTSGQTAHGSLFFRLTPSPKKLVLTFREAGEVREVTVDLAVLADLHRRSDQPTDRAPVGETLAPLAALSPTP